mmetsp:Transcript_3660/g.6926  ORF Transcript_3660/g.6926 Transcript_3660/m.6926 type:complete len:436 (-) Transcript_3660:2059-3366(-)
MHGNQTHDWKQAVADADPFRSQGTTYLHGNRADMPGGEEENMIRNPTGAVVYPISLATTFKQKDPGIPTCPNDPNSFGLGYEYSRTGNPTRGEFERAMAAAENAKYCVAFSSGSAAISAVVHLLSHSERILCVDDVYGGTQRYFRKIVQPTMNIEVVFADFTNVKGVEEEYFGNHDHEKFRLMWLETPTNPTLKISDIEQLATLAHKNNCLLAVDNTFCSPYFQSPVNLGADLVIHSVTKYINGHSDVVMGIVCTDNADLYKQLRFIQNGIGAVPSPFDCYLAHRGLKTLHIRMEAAARNAHAIALFLESHKGVTKVLYPGLVSHPQHDLAKRQQHGFGAMITFYCVGNRTQASIVLKKLKVFSLAESLGAVESLAESPALMTHASVPPDHLKKLNIDETMIRLSIGIESCADLVHDLDDALNAALESIMLPEMT